MKDSVIKAVFAFTHRVNDDGTYKVSFEYKAESNDISISIASKQYRSVIDSIVSKKYRSVIDILIQSYNVSSYLHEQGVVNSQQIADLIWLLNEVDNFVEEIEPMLDKEKSNEKPEDAREKDLRTEHEND